MLAAEPVTRLGSVIAALLPLLAFPSSSYASALDDGLGAASELSEGGQPAAAASLLEGLTQTCPDDYDLYLALGFHHHRAGAYRRAATHYRRAAQLSHGNPLARLGLGWALLGLGDRTGAARSFEAVLRVDPTNTAAREGLGLCRRSVARLSWGFGTSFTAYSGQTNRRWAAAVGVGATALLDEHLVISASYRGLAFETGVEGLSSQHEGHFELGWNFGDVTLLAHYGALSANGQGDDSEAHAFGVRAVYRGVGLLTVEASATVWSDQTVGRLNARWALPLGAGFYLAPELSAQWVDERVLGTAGAGLGLELSPVSVWLGGHFGAERRSTSLALSSISNLSDRVLGTVYGSLGVALTGSLGLSATYVWQALAQGEGPTQRSSDAHTGFLRLGGSF